VTLPVLAWPLILHRPSDQHTILGSQASPKLTFAPRHPVGLISSSRGWFIAARRRGTR
jgi:hypothetical protein